MSATEDPAIRHARVRAIMATENLKMPIVDANGHPVRVVPAEGLEGDAVPVVAGGPRGSYEERQPLAAIATHADKVRAMHQAASEGRLYDEVLAEVVGGRGLGFPNDAA